MKYDTIAAVYDGFTDGFDYKKYLNSIFSHCAGLPQRGLALDCGSGTGTLICALSDMGFNCTGVDMSEDMLNIAQKKIEAAGYVPHLICQELQNIDLYGAYDIAFCSLDTMNHIIYKYDLKSFLKKLYNFIEPGGYFIFDVKTHEFFKKTIGAQVFEHDDGSVAIIDGSFSKDHMYYSISVFEHQENGFFKKYESEIQERFYSTAELKSILISIGFFVVEQYNFCGRQIWITRRKDKDNNG